jgi:hypothetical protein
MSTEAQHASAMTVPLIREETAMNSHLSMMVITLSTMVSLGAAFAADVLTYGYDNLRTGANTSEVLLNPPNVNTGTFGKIFEYDVDPGSAVLAQPLVVTYIGSERRNIVIVATTANCIYAFDADLRSATAPLRECATTSNALLWSRKLGNAAAWGIMSTPVIDRTRSTVYAVAHANASPLPVFRLHGLDLLTGQDRVNSPVVIEGFVTLESGKSVSFEAAWIDPNRHGPYDLQVQRPGLALASGQVIVAFGTPGDRELSHGWVFAYDAITLRRSGIFCTTCATTAYSRNARYVPSQPVSIDGTLVQLADDVNIANTPGTNYLKSSCAPENRDQDRNRAGPGGGIWQSGRAPAVDSQGNVYFQTGNKLSCQINTPHKQNQWAGVDALNIYSNRNGIFDTSESLIRLDVANGISLNGWFRPRNWRTLDYRDLDLGGSGPLLIPGSNTIITGGKEHVIYAIDGGQLEGNLSRYLEKTKTPVNSCDLTGTKDPHVMCDADVQAAAPDASIQPGVLQSFVADSDLNQDPDGNQRVENIKHIMTGPVLWSNTEGTSLYIWIEDDVLRRYSLTGGTFANCNPLSSADPRAAMASHRCVAALEQSSPAARTIGHPGAALSISSNGAEPASGIVWAYTNLAQTPPNTPPPGFPPCPPSGIPGLPLWCEPYGILYAYDARTLQRLWSSEQIPLKDRIERFIHFSPPVVANGRVYVSGGLDARVFVFGLKNFADQQEHVFYRGSDGAVNHIFWDGSFHHDQWSSLAGAPVAAGDPATMLTGTQQHVFYRGRDGAINHITWDGAYHYDQWTALAGAPPAAGNPAAIATGGQQHIFYRGADGAVNHIFWDGSFHYDQWTSQAGAPPAAGNPAAVLTNGQQHIFYRGTDGVINHIFWDGSFHYDPWTTLAAAPPALGDPSVLVTNGQQHVFYRGAEGVIHHIFWDGTFHHDQWTSNAGAPPALGDPIASNANGQQHVFYRGMDGAISHIFWDGTFHFDPWSSLSGAPTAVGDPATLVTTGQQHAFYLGGDGSINHIVWDGQFRFDQWNLSAVAAKAAGNPATLVTP